MQSLLLVEPSKKHEKSFKNHVIKYRNINDEHYYNIYKKSLDNFDEYINDLFNHSKGIDIPQDWVATSTYWLVDNDEIVGVVRIRHEEVEDAGHIGCDISPDFRNKGYGTKALKLALKKAKEIGIKEAIVTCNIDNKVSRNIIEKNNGKLLGVIINEEENEKLYKFSILTEDA